MKVRYNVTVLLIMQYYVSDNVFNFNLFITSPNSVL